MRKLEDIDEKQDRNQKNFFFIIKLATDNIWSKVKLSCYDFYKKVKTIKTATLSMALATNNTLLTET